MATIQYDGTDLEVFTYAPDMRFNPKVTKRYNTQVHRGLDDTEERTIIHPRPKLSIEYVTLGLDLNESTRIRQFRYDITGRPVILPLFFDYVTIDDSVTAGASVDISHTTASNSAFSYYQPYAVLWSNQDYYELVEITAYAPQQVTVDNVVNTYSQGDKIFPVAVGSIDVSVSKAITGTNAEHQVIFNEEYF